MNELKVFTIKKNIHEDNAKVAETTRSERNKVHILLILCHLQVVEKQQPL